MTGSSPKYSDAVKWKDFEVTVEWKKKKFKNYFSEDQIIVITVMWFYLKYYYFHKFLNVI
jgi:hypothetical protein